MIDFCFKTFNGIFFEDMVNNSIFYLVDTFKLMWIMNILEKKMERKKNIKWKKINNILLLIFLLF